MTSQPSVALAATVHQPDDRLVEMVDRHLPALVACYAGAVAYCSKSTHPAILDLLDRHGVAVHMDPQEPGGIYNIGQVRRATIHVGLLAGTSHLQMCDFDRAIHWIAHYPGELAAVVGEIADYDLLVLGRTERAWASHPPTQVQTEPLFNKVFALVTGLEWDVGAGSRGLSRRAVEVLLERSQEMTVGLDAEWPLLLRKREGYRLGYRRCEGLEFETADRYRAEIEEAGGYAAWEAAISADPKRWLYRLQIATMIAEATVRYGG